MVKFGKNKFKALNRVAKSKKIAAASPEVSNKILKKKINAEKKVTFQKEVLQSIFIGKNELVENVTASKLREERQNHSKKLKKDKATGQTKADQKNVPKTKPVERRKKRQETQINDTKLIRRLMKKK